MHFRHLCPVARRSRNMGSNTPEHVESGVSTARECTSLNNGSIESTSGHRWKFIYRKLIYYGFFRECQEIQGYKDRTPSNGHLQSFSWREACVEVVLVGSMERPLQLEILGKSNALVSECPFEGLRMRLSFPRR